MTKRVDILVNYAGAREVRSVFELTSAESDCVIAINLSGPFHCAREAALRMRASGAGAVLLRHRHHASSMAAGAKKNGYTVGDGPSPLYVDNL
ncbi:SDR family oxidoreductase [Cupriavidus necator]|nr:SDR family oxidoreductase [Cupriavidus necator]